MLSQQRRTEAGRARTLCLIGLAVAALMVLLPTATASAQTQIYQVRLDGRWLGSLPRPGGAHFSPVIGATHDSNTSLFVPGEMASTGVEQVAELGSVIAMRNEINALISSGNACSLIGGGNCVGPTGSSTLTFTATAQHSEMSLLTMIAPSPDWFVGVNGVDLQNPDGTWVQQIVLDLNSYDAGTEEGVTFSLNNAPTNPQENIAGLDATEPGNPLFGAGSIATITITRITSITEDVTPVMATVANGTYVSGGTTELSQSDNADYSVSRNGLDLQSRVTVEFAASSPSPTPTEIDLSLESSVFARSAVDQSIDLWNFQTATWDEVDSRVAMRFSDATASVSLTGDLSRFVDPVSREVQMRVRYLSPSPRQVFTANIDQVLWQITY